MDTWYPWKSDIEIVLAGTNANEEAAGIDGFNENSTVPNIIFRKPEHVPQLIPRAEEEEEEEEEVKDKEPV
jgi:hypothetical protein